MLAALFAGITCAAGSVQGRVVDPAGASIGQALVRLLGPESRATQYRVQSDDSGAFHLSGVAAGVYTLRISRAGFREATKLVAVSDDSTTDLGTLSLELSGCDAAIACDYIGKTPPEVKAIIRTAEVAVSFGCGIDLEKAKSACGSDHMDIRIEREGSTVMLHALGDAKFIACNSRQAGINPVRIDGLGPGNDWCVLLKSQHVAHVMLHLNPVDAGAEFVAFKIVTRKN